MTPDSDLSITAWMAWFHLALMAVPLLIFMVRLEMQDWREAHPRIARERRARPAWTLRPHPAV